MARQVGRFDIATVVGAAVLVALATIGGTGAPPIGDALPPPADRYAHGASGSGLNGTGGAIAPSPAGASWPGTANDRNGGPFAFIGAQYGSLWDIPAAPNNSLGVGYCVMEDVGGTGTVTVQPTPGVWSVGDRARAAAVMASFGGDRVVPYSIDTLGAYDVATGEWQVPSLLGGGEYTRRRHIAVAFAVKMFLVDVSPSGVTAGLRLARDTGVVNGTDSNFPALRAGYDVARRFADIADRQHAVGGLNVTLTWGTPNGQPPYASTASPSAPVTAPVTVRVTDSTGRPVGYVPVVQLSASGIGSARSRATTASVNTAGDSADDTARRNAAVAAGWPTWDMATRMAADARFAVGANAASADVTDANGVARFAITIGSPTWEIAFAAHAPTGDLALYAGTGIQGQVTWGSNHRTATSHVAATPPPTTTTTTTTTLPPPPPLTIPPTVPTTTPPPTATAPTTTAPTTTLPPETTTTTTLPPETTTTLPEQPTTTTLPAATTTALPTPPPTEAPTTLQPTTSTATTTTTVLPTTSAPTTTTPAPTVQHGPELPRTGTADTQGRVATAGVALFLLGVALVIATRR